MSVATVLAATGGVLVSSAANAAEPSPSRDAASGIPNSKGAVTNWHLGKGIVYGDNLGPGMVAWFTGGPYNNTVRSDTIIDKSINEKDFSAAVSRKLDNGGLAGVAEIAPKTIEKIGGPFAANSTELGTVEIGAAGTYLVNTAAVFDRLDATEDGYIAPTTDTYPSLVLRYDDGKDAGTVMGSPISKAGFVELTSSATKLITVDKATTITVYGFGYNEDRSGKNGGQITAGAQISIVKVG